MPLAFMATLSQCSMLPYYVRQWQWRAWFFTTLLSGNFQRQPACFKPERCSYVAWMVFSTI